MTKRTKSGVTSGTVITSNKKKTNKKSCFLTTDILSNGRMIYNNSQHTEA